MYDRIIRGARIDVNAHPAEIFASSGAWRSCYSTGGPVEGGQGNSFGDATPRPLNPYAVATLPGTLSGCLLVTGGLRHNNLTKQPKSPAPGIFPAVPRCSLLAKTHKNPFPIF